MPVSPMNTIIKTNTPQVRWNYEKNRNNMDETLLHLLIIDEDPHRKLNGILYRQCRGLDCVEQVRLSQGAVGRSKYRYLLITLKGDINPEETGIEELPDTLYHDRSLYERRGTSTLEQYAKWVCKS